MGTTTEKKEEAYVMRALEVLKGAIECYGVWVDWSYILTHILYVEYGDASSAGEKAEYTVIVLRDGTVIKATYGGDCYLRICSLSKYCHTPYL